MMWMPTKEECMLRGKVSPWLRNDPDPESIGSVLAPDAPKDVQRAYEKLEAIYAEHFVWNE